MHISKLHARIFKNSTGLKLGLNKKWEVHEDEFYYPGLNWRI